MCNVLRSYFLCIEKLTDHITFYLLCVYTYICSLSIQLNLLNMICKLTLFQCFVHCVSEKKICI